MGLVDRFERKLESTVGDAFARVFGGSIVPQEVEGRLRREAEAGIRTVGGGRILAPNEYVITLSVPDHSKVSADPELTATAFAKHLEGYIREQGWQTYGDVVVRFEQSPNLHTGQFRARGAVNPDSTTGEPAPAPRDHAYTAEPGVPPMSDNPSYRGDQGQGRPGDEYYDDRYGRPQGEEGRGPEPRAPYQPEQGRYPEQGGYPDQGGYPPNYEQRGPGGYGPPPGGGYDQGYRQGPGGYDQGYRPGPGGYGPPPGGGYGAPGAPGAPGGPGGPGADYDYGRPPGPGRHEDGSYGAPGGRPGYPDHGGYPDQGYGAPGGGYGAPGGGRQDYGQDYGRGYGEPGGYGDQQGYGEPGGYGQDYGQDYGQGAGAGYGAAAGYGQGDYPAGGTAVTLQLDDGSGRTYQLREGANVIGRGQDAQFRLPDTGVSRRHLEIRWDGQTALLSDLNSTNGTTVNNAPVQEWQLADGDVIRLGHSEIIVRVH
ncbi:FhaA domain-containing protein [Mycobacterium sp. WMMD1722]|uniref:FhaA domain-containing protein n=1 Tax=Mycobacterium sp. WMMD1722 TaxID=3404117 RepID=UPI003BF566A3